MLQKICVLILTVACANSLAADSNAGKIAAANTGAAKATDAKPTDWSLNAIDAEPAWQITSGNPEIVVAIIDTGIDPNHPDIKEALWQNPGETGKDAQGRDKSTNGIDDDNNGYIDDVYGWDFTTQSAKANDTNGHGTHIAGIVQKAVTKNFGFAKPRKKEFSLWRPPATNALTLTMLAFIQHLMIHQTYFQLLP